MDKKERRKEWSREQRKKYGDYKCTLKCSICGENHPACLEFHHKNGKEKGNLRISRQVGYFSFGRILKEIRECIVLCANCHRKLHYHRE